jgi:hypothetical protein
MGLNGSPFDSHGLASGRLLAPEELLLQLGQLTRLELAGLHDDISPAHLQHTTALRHLKHLALDNVGGKDQERCYERLLLTPDTTPWLGQLTQLDDLVLRRINLQPAVLSGITQLRQLHLDQVLVQSSSSDDGSNSSTAASQFFPVLGGFIHLISLRTVDLTQGFRALIGATASGQNLVQHMHH